MRQIPGFRIWTREKTGQWQGPVRSRHILIWNTNLCSIRGIKNNTCSFLQIRYGLRKMDLFRRPCQLCGPFCTACIKVRMACVIGWLASRMTETGSRTGGSSALFDNLDPSLGSFQSSHLDACECVIQLLGYRSHLFHACRQYDLFAVVYDLTHRRDNGSRTA